jgi:nucleoside-diphosphate-sugar epimerase
MKVLILGGTGKISTPLTHMLLDLGEDVTLVNRGQRPNPFGQHVRVITADRSDIPTFEATVREAGSFDVVVDMIGFHPAEVEATTRTLAGRCGQYVFWSTVDVYQRPSPTYPYREGDARRALSRYGQDKIACEQVLERAHADGAFMVTLLRPAHTYDDTGFIHHALGRSTSLLDRMRRGMPVIVHGDGQSLWVAAHANDVATGFVGAIGNVRAYGRTYNLAGEEWLTWDAYHRIVADILGAPPPNLVHIPTDLLVRIAPRAGATCDANFRFPNIHDLTAARTDLGYRYTVSVRRGFAAMIAHLDAQGAITDADTEPWYDAIISAWRAMSDELVARLTTLDA